MEYFAQQLINSLPLGSIYRLIAIGYTRTLFRGSITLSMD